MKEYIHEQVSDHVDRGYLRVEGNVNGINVETENSSIWLDVTDLDNLITLLLGLRDDLWRDELVKRVYSKANKRPSIFNRYHKIVEEHREEARQTVYDELAYE